ncbi:hypothetical protein [Nocardioides sp. SYSU D00038]|uniref:hypothetical protein n=1 Tax=Nocardioides sp. SYSU D00038 TaxID=2812554 RepID=UPI001967AF92|nr:hypothetical protein [Nocardioides sp. SYSU D00038]
MTQTPSGAAATAPVPQATGRPAGRAQQPRQAVPAGGATAGVPAVEDVPRLLNRWQVIAVTACVLAGALTFGLQLLSWNANRSAADNTEQLVRVQNIQATFARANALATNGYLAGIKEDASQTTAYAEAIDLITHQLADAAEAQPADRQVLADLNAAVTDYAATIETARANNRQGFPIGSAYLEAANTTFGETAQPMLAALVSANQERADSEMDAQRPWLVVLPGLGAIAVLWWVNRQQAQRFHRRFNTGLAGAAIGLAATTLLAAIVSLGQAGDNDDLRDGSYQVAVDEAEARTAANIARSNESLRLVARGSGAAFEEAWASAAAVVRAKASDGTLGLWESYAALHDEIAQLDDDGDYDAAVLAAIDTGDGRAGAALQAFDTRSVETIDAAATATTDEIRSGNSAILVLAVLSLLVGLAAAGLTAWGIAQRRKEYA